MPEQRELDHGRYVLDSEPIASGGMGTVWRGLLGKTRVEEPVHHPIPGVMVNAGQVNRCEGETESDPFDPNGLRVRILAHDSVKTAANLLKEPADAADGHETAYTSHPKLGDEAELVLAGDDLGEAGIRISNLPIEVRYRDDDFRIEDDLMALVREIVAVANAEGSGAAAAARP